MRRLSQLPTLRINPAEKISFNYKGKISQGVGGDTIATALYSNGQRIFSRSIKYHRPRGLYSLDGESTHTFMQINGIPNVCAEKTILKKGLDIKPQNVKGSLENDRLGFMDKLDWAMPAGFYYQTMHKPAFVWPFAMKQVRKMAGTGKISPSFIMPGKYEEMYPQTDVCIIGGGPAGMSAALAAAEHKLRVVLIEARPWLGGFYDYRASEYASGVPLHQRARDLEKMIEEAPNIRVFTSAAMIGSYSNNLITAFQVGGENDHFNERYIEIRAESVVVATGCIERPLIFENNERPGVMQIACAHRLARTYGLLPGTKAVFSIGHDLGIETAIDLHDLGLKILCVADIREDGQDRRWIAALKERGIPFLRGWLATKAHGKKILNKVTLSTHQGAQHREYQCNTLVASAGMTPVTGPLTMAGAELAYDNHTGFFLPTKLPAKMHPAGRLLGLNHPLSVDASGRHTGLLAAADCGADVRRELKQAREILNQLPGPEMGAKFVIAPVKRRKCFICFDEDATLKHIDQALQMGFDVPELIKRFTAAGTGPGQWGIPGHNLPLYVAQYHKEARASVKPTTTRSPLVPTFLATYAGANRDMVKRTPVHDFQKRAGGIMRRMGVWRRARYFSEDFSCRDEISNVRNNVGMLDASTLGKFRIWGPDALKALQRVYVGDMSKVHSDKVKYSAMCNDDGCIADDGVIIKRGENDYYFTTSTARASNTIEWFRYHTRYDNWGFHMVNLTDAFGVINLAGPNARKVLEKVADTDLSNKAFPFVGYREFTLGKTIPVRAMRLGFVGELSYELHVPSSYMQSLWNLLDKAGEAFGICNFGIEAQNVLRMEKGHIIIGSESEQRTTLHDVGLGFLWDRNKPEAKTVGAVALSRTEKQEDRFKLVGFKMENTGQPPKDGSLIVDRKIRGYICMSRHSHTLNESIGLALVDAPLSKKGTHLEIFEEGCGNRRSYAHVTPTPFYDPEGKRLRM